MSGRGVIREETAQELLAVAALFVDFERRYDADQRVSEREVHKATTRAKAAIAQAQVQMRGAAA